MRRGAGAPECRPPAPASQNNRPGGERGTAVVSGTTGWTARLAELEALCREKDGAFFYASNYSLGVNLLFRINRRLAALVNRVGGYDVSIEEIHHLQKKDAPSGTAITLAEGILAESDTWKGWVGDVSAPENAGELPAPPAAAAPERIEIRSLREGTVPGIHTVTYESEDDILQLRHTIKHRRTLAMGAVIAAEFLCGKRADYTMDDLLK